MYIEVKPRPIPTPKPLKGLYTESAAAFFARDIIGEMDRRYGGQLVPHSLVRPVQCHLDREWEGFCRLEKGPFFLAEGCAVTGLRVGLYHGTLMFQWGTAFYPRPRHPSPETEIMPLGFYGAYDLYASLPQLHARYGPRESAASWDSRHPEKPSDSEHENALMEARRRAARANVFWGSDIAFPPPLGAVSMPLAPADVEQRSTRPA